MQTTELNRDQLQRVALETLMENKRLILNWGTGVGKSRPAINAMQAVLQENPKGKILLVVQETPHKENWKREMQGLLGNEETEHLLRFVTIDCYASLHKHRDSSWDLIVFDEGHHLRSEKRQAILASMKANRVLLLSATISDNQDGDSMLRTLIATFGTFKILKFGLQNAIDNKMLGEPEIHIIPIVLTEEKRKTYDQLKEYQDKKKKEYFSAKREAGLEFDSPDNEETAVLKEKWLNSGARRKKMLGLAKTTVAKKIIRNQMKGKRFICFCASLKQIQWLSGENYVSSKNTNKTNKENIEAFNNGSSNSLFAMGMLQEGQNLAGIEAGLIIQLDGKARPFIQKFGRVMRAKAPVLYILFAVNTIDSKYLKTALQDIDERFIIVHDPIDSTGEKCQYSGSLFADEATVTPRSVNESQREAVQQRTPDRVQETMPTDKTKVNNWQLNRDWTGFLSPSERERNVLEGTLIRIETSDNFGGYYTFCLYQEDKDVMEKMIVRKQHCISLLAQLLSVEKGTRIKMQIKESKGGKKYFYLSTELKDKIEWNQDFLENLKKVDDLIRYLDTKVLIINQDLKS